MKFQTKDGIVEYKDINDPLFAGAVPKCLPYTMHSQTASFEVPYAFYCNIKYVVENEIPGDIVECGVWRGGMMLLAALTLLALGDTSRTLYLYDTFDGMPRPDIVDRDWDDNDPMIPWAIGQQSGKKFGYGGPAETVRALLLSSGYPEDKIVLVEGMVEDTIPGTVPDRISILRLDTDFYKSTLHELRHLYPILSVGGVLVIDDYGYYQGARLATDQYLEENRIKMMLARIHWSVRQGIKIEPI